MKPVVAIYSTFLQRAYDQLIHDVALQNLDVLFAIDRAGLVGLDGATHQGAFDFLFSDAFQIWLSWLLLMKHMAWKMFNTATIIQALLQLDILEALVWVALIEKWRDDRNR